MSAISYWANMALKITKFSSIIGRRFYSTLPPVAQFTKLSEGTPQDYQNAQVFGHWQE